MNLFKCLYRVVADEREMYVVASSEDEVKRYCFMLFDYNNIKINFMSYQANNSEFPYIIDRGNFAYA